MKSMRKDDGASAVEFAILMPVLILLVFGIVQFGLAFHRLQGLEAAAREGARLASIGEDFGDVKARVKLAQSLFTADHVTVTSNFAASDSTTPCDGHIGQDVTVTATVDAATYPQYAISIPLLPDWRIKYQSVGTFRCEKGS